MRYRIYLNGLAVLFAAQLGLVPAAQAEISTQVVGTGGTLFNRQVSNELTRNTTEAIQVTEGLATDLIYDNAYVHTSVGYRFSATQVANDTDLNFLSHDVAIDLDINRLMDRLSENGNLDITLDATLSPSLPVVELGAAGSTAVVGAAEVRERFPSLARTVQGNQLGVLNGGSFWGYGAGLNYGADLGPVHRVGLNARYEDVRTNGITRLNSGSTLNVAGEISRRDYHGSTGFSVGHRRFIRGVLEGQKTIDLKVFHRREGARLGWGVHGGAAYRIRESRFDGIAGANARYLGKYARLVARYESDLGFNQLGTSEVQRAHSVRVVAEPARYSPRPVFVTGSGYYTRDTRRFDLGVQKVLYARQGRTLALGYTRSYLRWRDTQTGAPFRRDSDTIGLQLNWLFW